MNLRELFENTEDGEETPKVATSDRMERILRQLRIRNPAAKNDLEALLYDFERSQKKDRKDIKRLSTENETAEQTIRRIEAELDQLKSETGIVTEGRELRGEPKNVAIEINGKLWKIIQGESDFSPLAIDRAEKMADTIRKNALADSRPVPEINIYLTREKPKSRRR